MNSTELKELCKRAGCVRLDIDKIRIVLGLKSKEAVYNMFRRGCKNHDHIQKLEALAREGKDANS